MRKNHRLLGKIGKTEILSELSKAAFLIMKWENCNSNVVEHANSP